MPLRGWCCCFTSIATSPESDVRARNWWIGMAAFAAVMFALIDTVSTLANEYVAEVNEQLRGVQLR